jgi:hypothetical protein
MREVRAGIGMNIRKALLAAKLTAAWIPMIKTNDTFHHLMLGLTLIAGLAVSQQSFAANPLSANQADELGKLYRSYGVDSQAAIAARKQAELLQTEIVTQQARLTELKGKAEQAENELMELQEFERKKPGKVKPEEMEAARGRLFLPIEI